MYVVSFQQFYIFVEQLNKLCNVCNETLFGKYNDFLQLESSQDNRVSLHTYKNLVWLLK